MDPDEQQTVRKWRRFQTLKENLQERWDNRANAFTLILVIFIILPLAMGYFSYIPAPSEFPEGEIVTIPEGSTLQDIAFILEREQVVRSALALRAAVWIFDGERDVIAGDYLLKEPQNVIQVARMVIAGAFGMEPIRIRIPEGATSMEMADIYERYLPRFDREVFLRSARPLEGYLFPDTYFFMPNATEATIIRTMVDNFEVHITEIEEELAAFEHSLQDVVIMASLLEKEASIQRDRRMIAGVLWNRLEIDMPLQVDAAFLYFLGRTTFDLTLEDLQYDSPYNTYRYKGLPVGPIANPGLRSLLAAVTPIEHDYLFYLADYDFVTHYSETYEEHLRKKRVYLY